MARHRFVLRRVTSVIFSRDNQSIFVSDKAGDVYVFPTLYSAVEPSLCLGVMSMMMDVVCD